MIRLVRNLMFFLATFLLLFVAAAFAQEGPPPATGLDWKEIVGLVLGSGVITAVVQVLRVTGLPQKIPGALRPFIGSGIAMAGAWLASVGLNVDLSALQMLFMGAGSAVLFDFGKELGVLKSTKNG